MNSTKIRKLIKEHVQKWGDFEQRSFYDNSYFETIDKDVYYDFNIDWTGNFNIDVNNRWVRETGTISIKIYYSNVSNEYVSEKADSLANHLQNKMLASNLETFESSRYDDFNKEKHKKSIEIRTRFRYN